MNKYIQQIANELKGKTVKINNANELSEFLEQSKKLQTRSGYTIVPIDMR